ncbi:MAG: HNH endonuclease [Bacillota bacterium]
MGNDYRNTAYCFMLQELNLKKKTLNDEICKDHPRAKIIYNQVKDNDNSYKAKFMKIYNYKCSYCGNSIDNISSTLFEVDHYICESSFDSKEIAGKIENLVLACYDCNRSKSSFLIKEEYREILNPDLEYIKNVFYRDELYYIQISEEYKNDEFVEQFYDKLKLVYQSRRLDFLLMNINGLCKKLDGNPQAAKLNVVLRKLQQKRNLTSCKEFSEDYALA